MLRSRSSIAIVSRISKVGQNTTLNFYCRLLEESSFLLSLCFYGDPGQTTRAALMPYALAIIIPLSLGSHRLQRRLSIGVRGNDRGKLRAADRPCHFVARASAETFHDAFKRARDTRLGIHNAIIDARRARQTRRGGNSASSSSSSSSSSSEYCTRPFYWLP